MSKICIQSRTNDRRLHTPFAEICFIRHPAGYLNLRNKKKNITNVTDIGTIFYENIRETKEYVYCMQEL
jgi:hypothetical protein